MPSFETQKAKNKRFVAGLPKHPQLSEESRRVTLLYPDLHLRVWCSSMGINVLAYIDSSDGKGRLHRVDVAHATFRGTPPNAEDVALWGARALATWLEARILELGYAELNAA